MNVTIGHCHKPATGELVCFAKIEEIADHEVYGSDFGVGYGPGLVQALEELVEKAGSAPIRWGMPGIGLRRAILLEMIVHAHQEGDLEELVVNRITRHERHGEEPVDVAPDKVTGRMLRYLIPDEEMAA